MNWKFTKWNVFWFVFWILFTIYSFVFAPASPPETGELVMRMLTGDTSEINWVTISLFNLMGVWSLIIFAILASDGYQQKVPWWIFALGSFFLGAFVLLPYFFLREARPKFEGNYKGITKLAEGRVLGLFLTIISIGLISAAIVLGDWQVYINDFMNDGFIHVMSLDFIVLYFMFLFIVQDDLKRRSIDIKGEHKRWISLLLIPVIGATLYLIIRPKLQKV